MVVSTLTTDTVTLKLNNQEVEVALSFPDQEAGPEDFGKSEICYTKTMRLEPVTGSFSGDNLELAIAATVKSYNEQTIDAYGKSLIVDSKPTTINISLNTLSLDLNATDTIAVTVLDETGKAMEDVKVIAASSAQNFVTVEGEKTTNATGQAEFTITGKLPGKAELTFTVENTDLIQTAEVTVLMIGEQKPAQPTANLQDGARVVAGTKLILACSTANAEIYYTTDGQCPCNEGSNRTLYTQPITITEDTTFRVRSLLEGIYSEGLAINIYIREDINGEGSAEAGPPTESEEKAKLIFGIEDNVTGTANIEGDKAVLSVDVEKLSDLLEQGIETENLIVDVTTIDRNISSAEISEEDFSFMAELVQEERNRLTGLTIRMDSGELNLDQSIVSLIHELGGIVTVSVSEVETWKLTEEQKSLAANRLVIDITIKAGEYLVGDLAGGQIRVKIPYELNQNENPDYIVIWHLNSQGELEAYNCIYEDGYVMFTLNHLSQYIVSYFPFKDVEMNKWYYGNVAYVYQNKLMEGIGNEFFAPDIITNRAMIVNILYRLEGSPAVATSEDFADVAKTAWYYDGVMWAKENGIAQGMSNDLFDPNGILTREQLATLLYRYDNYKGKEKPIRDNLDKDFADWSEVSTWAEEAMVWSINNKILQGIGTRELDPKGHALRSQMAAILQRYLMG